MRFRVSLRDAAASADDVAGAFAAAAELDAATASELGLRDARELLVIEQDRALDEGATELAREGLRPVFA